MSHLDQLLSGDLDLAALDGDELRELHTALTARAAELDTDALADDDQALQDLETVLGHIDSVAEQITAHAAADERAQRVADLRRRREQIVPPAEPTVADPQDEPDPDVDDTAADDGGEPADPPAEPEPDSTPARREVRPVPVAASARRPTLSQIAARTRPVEPTQPDARPRIDMPTTLTAAANMPGMGLGAVVSWDDLSKSMLRKLNELRTSRSSEQHATASITWEYPAERRLGDGDSTRQIESALSQRAVVESMEQQGGLQAVVAAGGICGPAQPFYDLQVDSIASRPVRDSLPSFQPERGTITFNPSPTFAGVGSSATAFWTAANDANPTAPATKPVQTFTCPSPLTATVYGIPTRLQFSNFQERYSPEMVAANTQLAMANAARVSEVQLLTSIASGSTRIGLSAALVSFTRDLMAVLEAAVANYRYRHRLDPAFPLRAMFPMFVKSMIRTDFLRETAHDRDGSAGDNLKIADAYVDSLFAARGVIPTFYIDGLPHSTAGTTLGTNAWDYPDQYFGAPADGTAFGTPPADASAGSSTAGTWWPSRIAFLLFAEGTWVFLDGGRIDLGVIRDSVLAGTNQYQTFVEPIEGIVKRGYESQLIVVPTKLTGQSISTVTAPGSLPV
jgi:hypothetical protein